jgi:acetyl esterase
MSKDMMQGPDEIKTYKQKDKKGLKAHIFYPDIDSNKKEQSPAFLFFHPGGWTMGEPQWGYEMCRHYASKGLTSISFQYRLSSIGGSTPADALADVKSAIRWTKKNAAALGIDPEKVIAGAISAGSHLATCTACIEGFDDPSDDLTISPVPDVLVFQSACLNTVIIDEFTSLLQGRASSEELSPFHHLKAGMPPMCIIHGKADNLVPFGSIREYVEKSVKLGNRCELHPFEDTDHFFGNVDSSEVFSRMDGFLMSLGYL